MSNILLLPKFSGAGTSFAITTTGDWNDAILFTAVGSPATPINMVGAITATSTTVTVASTAGLLPGQPISQVPGIPAGTFIGTIPTPTTLTMVDAASVPVTATVTDAEASLTCQPLPLDLTNITFLAQMRKEAGAATVYLTAKTGDGTLNNGGVTGILAFNIPQATLAHLFPDTYVIDIVATADGSTINLFPEGPATVTLLQGISQP
jgi:hypothetical protein